MPETQDQNLALTVFYVPHSLDSGGGLCLAVRQVASPSIFSSSLLLSSLESSDTKVYEPVDACQRFRVQGSGLRFQG